MKKNTFPGYFPDLFPARYRLAGRIFLMALGIWVMGSCPSAAQTVTKQLYFSDPSQALDRVDPVATADATTAQTALLGVGGGAGSVIVDASSSGKVENGNTVTISHTTGTGSNRLMIVASAHRDDKDPTGVTYGGIPLTLLGVYDDNAHTQVFIYYLNNPPSGTADVVVNLSAASHQVVGVTTFSGVDLSSTPAIFNLPGAGGDPNPSVVTATTAVGDLVYGIFANEKDPTLTAGGGQTLQWDIQNDNVTSNKMHMAGSTKVATSASTNMSWTMSNPDHHENTALVLKPVPGPPTITNTTFTQSPALCSNLTVKAGQTITVTAYVSILSGSMPATPGISAALSLGGVSTLNLTNPSYSGGLLTWTTSLPSDVTIPSGQTVSLTITTAQAGVTFYIDYDSQTKPSKISLPVSTYIDITSLALYNAAYPGGSVITTANNGSTVYARAVVTDPFGFADITGLDITITPPGSNVAAIPVANSTCTRTYQYVWNTPATPGDYTIGATAREGFENMVTDVAATNFSLCPLTVSGSATNSPTCASPSSGVITLTASGGSGPYNYNWSRIAPAGTGSGNGLVISSLTTGTYNITVTANSGCVGTTTVVIAAPSGPLLSTSVTNVTCAGNDGTINLTASAGSGSYTYAWNDGPTTEDRSGLSAGTYTVIVTDQINGCTATASATVASAAVIGDNAFVKAVDCYGGNDGLINLTPTNGVAPYTFTWADGPTSEDRIGLAAGAYAVTITDNAGCSGIFSYTIAQPAALSLSTSVTEVTCNSSGSIDLSVSGGTLPYTYDWADIPGTANTQDRSGLQPNTYGVTVTDSKGCTSATSVTLNPPVCDPAANTVCTSETMDMFSVDPDPFVTSYVWTVPPGAVIVSGQGTSVIKVDWTNAAPGTNQVCVHSINACGESANVCRIVYIRDVTATASFVPPACAGGNLQLLAGGGMNYQWSGPDGFAANTDAPVIYNTSVANSGTYSVTVTDEYGCSDVASVSITIYPTPSASLSVTNATCGMQNGAIDLTPSGGTMPYAYAWSNNVTTQDLSGIGAGTYNVTVTDNNGCTVLANGSVVNTDGLSVSLTPTNILCNGGNTGAISLAITGGTGPFQYQWSNGATTQNLSGLTAGAYEVTVTDLGENCQGVAAVTLTQPAALQLNKAVTNVNCFGASTGAIDLSVSGGVPNYTYAWSNLPGSPDPQDQTGLPAGIYTVTVTDANNCPVTTSATISQPAAALGTSIVVLNVSCNGAADGVINLTVTGGTAPYSYNWGDGPTTEDRTGLGPNTYSVTITDAKGCITATSTAITEPVALSVSTSSTNVNCYGSQTGAINLTVSGGTTPFTYSWSNGATTEDVSGLAAGTYGVTVVDAHGCTISTAAVVTQPAAALALSTSVTNVLCNGTATGAIDLTVTGGSPAYNYSWSNLPGSPDPQDQSVLAAGTYTVTVTDNKGCTASTQATINQPTALSLTGFVTPATCNGTATGSINLTAMGGTSPYSYNWGGGVTTEDRNNLVAGTYIVTVTDANSCTGTQSFTVTQPVALNLNTFSLNSTCAGANNGSVNLTVAGGTGPFSYTWSNNQSSEDISGLAPGSYTVTVTDANLCTATASATTGQPTAISIPGNIIPNCPMMSNASVDISPSGGTLPYTYLWTGGSTNQDLIGVGSGTYTVTITDGNGCTATASFVVMELTVTLLVVNETCNLNDGAVYATPADGLPPYSYSWSNGSSSAAILGVSNGTYTVTVTAGICTATASATIAVPVCNPPVAMDDNYTTPENTPVSGSVAPNDSDPDNLLSELTFLPLSTPPLTQGLISWDPSYNGDFTFLPVNGFTGIVAIPYQVCDPLDLCDVALLTITVTAVNSPPVAVNDDVTTPEDTPVTVCVPQNDSDPDGNLDVASVMVIENPDHGAYSVNPVTGCITYTPAPNYNGPDTLRYKICDTENLCDTAYVFIAVSPVNDPPVAVNDTAYTLEDTPVSFNIVVNDSDSDGNIDPGTIDLDLVVPGQQTSYTVPTQGTFTVNLTTGVVTFTPVPNFNGTVNPIGYSVCDDGTPLPVQCDQAGIYVTVTPVNDPPVAVDDPVTTPEDTPVTVCVLANDTDPDGPLAGNGVMVLDGPSHGTYTLSLTTGCVTYTPDPNYNGPDTIRYKVCDSGMPVLCDTAYVLITVIPVNDLPNAINDGPVPVVEDTPTPVNVLVNDDFGGDGPSTGTINLITPPLHGAASLNDGGTPFDPTDDSFSYTPNLNYNGPDQFTYQICDSNGDCDLAVVTLNVTPVNDPPLANNDNATTPEDTPVAICVLDNDTDPDGNISGSGVMVLDGPSHGTYTLNPVTGCVTYTPNPNYFGPDTMRYKICDTGSPVYCDTAYVFIEVGPINDLPDAVNDVTTTNEDTPVNVPVLTNDTFGGDGPSTGAITVFTNPLHGTAVVNTNGTPADPTDDYITYTPAPNYNGPDQLTYQICDANGDCDVAVVDIAINPVNDPPVANKDMVTTPEDTPVTIPVLNNDTDPDNNIDPTSVAVTDPPNHGTAAVNPDGSITYTPDPNYNGPDTLIYNVCDTGMPVYCDTALVVISVTPVNDLPDAVNDVSVTNEDTPVIVPVLTNDSFGGDGPNTGTISVFTNPSNGTAVVNNNGTPTDPTDDFITYTPNPNYNGPDQFTYQICDANGDCDVAVVSLTINPVNDPPLANHDNATTPEDTPVTIPVLNNDTDPDNNLDPTTVTVTDAPDHGTATVNPNGSITYTPDPNYNGPDTLVYQVCDTGLPVYCDTALVVLNVTPANDPPMANDDYATTPEDTPVTFNITSNDIDTDGAINPATVDLNPALPGQQTAYTVPGQGTFTVNLGTGDVTFTPVANFNGAVTPVAYNVCDNGTPLPAQCDQAIIYVTVTPVNDPPVAVDDNATTPEDTPVTVCVLNNDTDVDGPLSGSGVMIIETPDHGTATLNTTTGCITYTPDLNYNGPDTLRYKICDSDGLCDTAYVFIEVGPVNDLPDAVNDLVLTNEDTPVIIPVLSNDTFGGDGPNAGPIAVFTNPLHGTVVVNTNGTPTDPTDDNITYTPVSNYNGPDQFTYQICDSNGDCDVAVVTLVINPVNDPPVAVDDPVTTPEDTPVTVCVLDNDFDVDGPLSGNGVMIIDPAGHGTGVLNPSTGCITYTPDPNYNGPDTIRYKVCDAGGLCDTAYVLITVTPLNDPPVANDDNATTPEDTPVTFNITSNDTDTDGAIDPGTIDLNPALPGQQTSYTVPGEGTFIVNLGNGDVTFTPVANFNGMVTPVPYSVCDNGTPLPVQCDQAIIYVTVIPVNDPPVANNDNATTPEDTPVTVCVATNDTDPDGNLDVTTVMIIDAPNHGSAAVNPVTGCVTYTPAPNYNGPDTLYYKICDTGTPVLCDTAYVTINIIPVNDLPDAVNDMAATPEDTPVNVPVLTNDTFGGDGPNAGQINVFTSPSNGTAVVNTNGTPTDPTDDYITYTPNANYTGPDQFTYQICDANGDCDIAVVNISVAPVNDPPVANDDPVITPEDTPVTVCVLNNDSDVDGPLSGSGVMIIAPANHGSATLNPATGCITYSPDPNYTGPDTLQYKVCDAGGLCDTAYVLITVTPVNDPPVANDDNATTPEDTPVTFNITVNDTDTDGVIDPGTIDLNPGLPGQQTSYTVPGQGTFTVNLSTGDVTFMPVPNFNGAVTPISYSVCDNGTPLPVQCDQAVIYVTVTPVNDPPVAADDPATTPEDTPVTVCVLTNDSDVDGPLLGSGVMIIDPANHGAGVLNSSNGCITYTPDPNYNGPDTIQYKVCDAGGLCDTAYVIITVLPVNDLPDAKNDVTSTQEDTPVNIPVLTNDTFGGDGPSTGPITLFSPPLHGTATLNDNGTPSDPTDDSFTYTPAPNYNGPDQFLYQICDANGDCDLASVTLTIVPVNDPPVAVDDPVTTPEDTPVTICVLANDNDPDGPLSGSGVMIIDAADHGTAILNPSTGCITYTPAPNYNGPDTIQYKICDGTGLCDTAYVIIDVLPVNDLPNAANDNATTTEDTPVTILVLTNDTFGGDGPGVGAITLFTPPSHGTAVVDDNGTPSDPTDDKIVYTPALNFTGVDQFNYEICDLNGDCDLALVRVTITPVNDPPLANDDPVTTPEDIPVVICVLTNDTDVDNVLTGSGVMIIEPAGHGTGVLNPSTGCITYTPDPNYNGPDTIRYKVCDTGGLCDTAYVLITVTPVNDLPVANNDNATTAEDTPVTISVLTNDSFGGDGPSVGAISMVAPPLHGTVTLNDGGTPNDPTDDSFTYTPNANYNGPDQFTYRICDANGDCDLAVVNISITPVNDPPVANDDPVTTPEDLPVTVCVLNNDSDVDGPLAGSGVMIIDPANHGSATLNPTTGCITYTPDPNYNGPDTIQYKVCDAGGLCDTAYVIIDVLPLNDPPLVLDNYAATPEDTPVTFNIIANDSDPDGNIDPGTIDLDPLTPGQQTSFTVPSQGIFIVDLMTGDVTFTPAPNFSGTVTPISYTVCDDGTPLPVQCGEAQIYVTVTPDNDPPVAVFNEATTSEDTPVTFNITNNDTDTDGSIDLTTIDLDPWTPGQQLTYAIPGQGVFTANVLTGEVTFTPSPEFSGTVDPIAYEVCDTGTPLPAQCDTAAIYVTVTPVNDPPVVQDDYANTNEDTPTTFNILTNDSDIDGNVDPGTIDLDPVTPGQQTSFTIPGQGIFTVNLSNGDVTFTPEPNFNGTVVPISYSVCDDGTPLPPECAVAQIYLSVLPANDPPIAYDDYTVTPEDTPVSIPVLGNDTDPDDNIDPATVTVTDGPDHGTASVNPDGSITYTPDPNYNGPDTLTYSVCDTGVPVLCDTALVIINVIPVNDLPVANSDTATLNEGDPLTNLPVLTNDDFGGDGPCVNCAITITGPAGNGTSSVNDGGTPDDPTDDSVDYTPDPNFSGQDTIVYQICDANGDCDTALVVITVIAAPCVDIEAWVYLEGAAILPDGSQNYALPMRTDLNNLRILPGQVYQDPFFLTLNYTPAGQPYNIAPWNYMGTEGAGFDSGNDLNFADANYPSTVVDWVLVSLRDNPAGTGGPVCQAAALLHSDGHIEFVDQFACCDIDQLQNYYLVIEHRNHLIVMSHEPISIVNNKITYDFRTQQSYIDDPFLFGIFAGQKQILPGVFAMYAGNGDQTQTTMSDTDINFGDRTFWEGENGDVGQYRIGDYNLNGDTNFNDRRAWEINNGKFTSVPRN